MIQEPCYDEYTHQEVYLLLGLNCPREGYLVLPWDRAPEPLRRAFCRNGGDEDWMIITREDPESWTRWLDKTDTMEDPDLYKVDDIYVHVGTHG